MLEKQMGNSSGACLLPIYTLLILLSLSYVLRRAVENYFGRLTKFDAKVGALLSYTELY